MPTAVHLEKEPNPMMDRPTYTLTLRSEPCRDDPDGIRRLRWLLKRLLRQHGLRCLSIGVEKHQQERGAACGLFYMAILG